MSEKEVYITVAPKSAHDTSPEYTVWTREAAINIAKTAAQLNGYTYEDDEKALVDFIVGHWAWPATLVDV